MMINLRPEIEFTKGAPFKNGEPSWTVFDELYAKYFQVGNLEKIIICARQKFSQEDTIDFLKKKHFIDVTLDQIKAVDNFVCANNLIVNYKESFDKVNKNSQKALTYNIFKVAMKLMYLKVPLFCPEKLLISSINYVGVFFQPMFWISIFIFAIWTAFSLLDGWSVFYNTFTDYNSPVFYLLYISLLVFVKFSHELGHAFAVKRLGCNVRRIGVSFIFLWPVLYTDTSDIWRISERQKRMTVAFAGIAVEFMIAVLGALIWMNLPEGMFKSAIYLTVLTSWLTSLFININPFIKFDGYFLLIDFLNFPNLQKRAFDLLQWRIINCFFIHRLPLPESCNSIQFNLMVYALCTIVVRALMILGISGALSVYFPELISFEILVAIFIFIFLIPSAISLINKRGDILHMRKTKSLFTLLGMCGIIGVLYYNMISISSAPSILKSANIALYYAPQDSHISEISLVDGDYGNEGDLLIQTKSDELDFQTKIQNIKYSLNEWLVSAGRVNNEILKTMPIYVNLKSELEGLIRINKERVSNQSVALMKSGVVTYLDEWRENDPLKDGKLLAYTYDPNMGIVDAFVKDSQLDELTVGMDATFYPDQSTFRPVKLKLKSISEAPQRSVSDQLVSSVHGGALPSREESGSFVAENSFFKVAFSVKEEMRIIHELRGRVVWDKP